MAALTVLVVSTEPIIGALVALYVEVHGYRAVLAEGDRSPESEVKRSGAVLIIVDVDHRDGFSPSFVEQQRDAGRRVIAFSAKRLGADVRARAAPFQVPSFALPIEPAEFRALLDGVAATAAPSKTAGGSARADGAAEPRP